jgi:hypothetical protein
MDGLVLDNAFAEVRTETGQYCFVSTETVVTHVNDDISQLVMSVQMSVETG